ncbi:MAG: PAS domain-containing sensor histidine kinase [Euryarchaeota archaeon]|nr:PAS domain-containing sensor histidine kinase [Euryarchaeota archaeon]
MNNVRLLTGWFLFVYGLLFDLLDEFTKEPDLFSVHFEAFLTSSGLLLIALGFYNHFRDWDQTKTELQQNHRRMELASEIEQQGVWEVDLKEDKTYFSPHCYLILGYDSHNRMDLNIWKALIHPEDADFVLPAIKQAMLQRKPIDNEFRMKAANGEWRWIHIKAGFFDVNSNSELDLLVGTAIDITARKKAEDKLHLYNGRLKHEIDFKEMLLDILRHDLLNPAGVVKGYADILSGKDLDPQVTGYVEKIKKSNDALIVLINNASELARIQSLEEIPFRRMDLSSMIDETLDELDPVFRKKDIAIVNELKGAYPIKANPILKLVFVNLFSNAAKYSPEGSIVRVYIEDSNDFWRVNIVDSGPGIADEDKNKIFERFSRVHKGNIKGSGIGLAIVRHILKLHQGDVGVKNNPQGGSIFFAGIRKA